MLSGGVMSDKRNDFKRSVEFDLYKSELGNTLLKEYHIKSQLSKSELSNLYLLERKRDTRLFVLKAISSTMYMTHPIALKKYPGFTEITAVYETSAYRYVLKPYVPGIALSEKIATEGVMRPPDAHQLLIQMFDTTYRLLKEAPSLYIPNLKLEEIIIDSNMHAEILSIESIRCAPRDVEDYLLKRFNRLYMAMTGLEPPLEINTFNQWGYFLIASKGIHL